MKRKLIALTAAAALSLGTIAVAHAEDQDGPRPHKHRHGEMGRHHWGNPLDKLDEDLNLTADQKAKVQPIVDQTKPQLKAIHQDAMEKSKAVIDNAITQIRPMLTPEQQTKLDALKTAHDHMKAARKEMHDAKNQ